MNKAFRKVANFDFDLIDLHPAYEGDITVVERIRSWVGSGSPCVYAYTVQDKEGNPIAILGGMYIYSKVGELWAIVDKSVDKTPMYFARATKFLIDHEFERLQLDRMQLIVRADMPQLSNWAKFLGFQPEAVMRKYGELGIDHILFAKVRG